VTKHLQLPKKYLRRGFYDNTCMTHQHIVIIGAGPCGLGAAWQLTKHKVSSFHIYEASDHVGGLSSSITDAKGFTWDMGGHVLHTTDSLVKQLFLDLPNVEYLTYIRKAFVLVGTTRVPYPFQYNVSMLPQKVQRACTSTQPVIQTHKTSPTSFRDWILKQFGSGMAKYFFFPYNKKLWRYPLEKMTWQWTGTRVAPKQEEQMGSSWGKNATFMVPTVGGIGAIWTAMATVSQSHISFSKQVVAIDAIRHIVQFQDESQVSYDHLLSTMPILSLATMIQGVSLPFVSQLASTGVYVVGIGLRGTVPPEWKHVHWMYIPESCVPFFRVSVYSNYGIQNAPSGTWSLLFEVSYDGKKPLDEQRCVDDVIRHAKKLRFISEHTSIVDTFFTAIPVAYPVPTHGRDEVLQKSMEKLARYNISSLGRFGLWKYEQGNMDQVARSGIEWANTIVKTMKK